MRGVNIGTNQPGFQKVVFENITDVHAGGAHIEVATADRFKVTGETHVIPAGALVGRQTLPDGTFKLVKITAGASGAEATFDVTPLGLVHFDVLVDDMPSVAIVLGGTVRIDALPEDEMLNWESLAKALPKITFI